MPSLPGNPGFETTLHINTAIQSVFVGAKATSRVNRLAARSMPYSEYIQSWLGTPESWLVTPS